MREKGRGGGCPEFSKPVSVCNHGYVTEHRNVFRKKEILQRWKINQKFPSER